MDHNYYLIASSKKINTDILGALTGQTGFFRHFTSESIMAEIIREASLARLNGFRGQAGGKDLWIGNDIESGISGPTDGLTEQQDQQGQEEAGQLQYDSFTDDGINQLTITEEKIGQEKEVMTTTYFNSSSLVMPLHCSWKPPILTEDI